LTAEEEHPEVTVVLGMRDGEQMCQAGSYAEGTHSLVQTSELAREHGLYFQATNALAGAAVLAGAGGDLSEQRRLASRLLEFGAHVHEPLAEELALHIKMQNSLFLSAFAEIERLHLQRPLFVARSADPPLALSRAWRGDLQGALQLLPERSRAIPDQWPLVLATRALLLVYAQRHEEALEALGESTQLAQQIDIQVNRLLWLTMVAEPIARIGDAAVVREVGAELNRLADLQCGYGVAADWQRGLLAARLGAAEQAEHLFESARVWSSRHRYRVAEALAIEGAAELAQGRGDQEHANELLDSAAALFLATDSNVFLERVLARKDLLKA
jgi:hypothetical protein